MKDSNSRIFRRVSQGSLNWSWPYKCQPRGPSRKTSIYNMCTRSEIPSIYNMPTAIIIVFLAHGMGSCLCVCQGGSGAQCPYFPWNYRLAGMASAKETSFISMCRNIPFASIHTHTLSPLKMSPMCKYVQDADLINLNHLDALRLILNKCRERAVRAAAGASHIWSETWVFDQTIHLYLRKVESNGTSISNITYNNSTWGWRQCPPSGTTHTDPMDEYFLLDALMERRKEGRWFGRLWAKYHFGIERVIQSVWSVLGRGVVWLLLKQEPTLTAKCVVVGTRKVGDAGDRQRNFYPTPHRLDTRLSILSDRLGGFRVITLCRALRETADHMAISTDEKVATSFFFLLFLHYTRKNRWDEDKPPVCIPMYSLTHNKLDIPISSSSFQHIVFLQVQRQTEKKEGRKKERKREIPHVCTSVMTHNHIIVLSQANQQHRAEAAEKKIQNPLVGLRACDLIKMRESDKNHPNCKLPSSIWRLSQQDLRRM
ncbi:hypothetical protein VP01_293g2 [Puccinia sorghi]|uniref:Uncharacterized protein n=1 Tax=Puccinia sorghi TaxID=27349 RepID=A0A0L6V2T7_9BASI|nr:hypothetical protein VP01_293g2 [Puccinia sorghi]